MPFVRTTMIIAALVLGWVAMRAETSAHIAPLPAPSQLIRSAP